MAIEESLYTALSGDSDVNALVANGTSPETYRIFPNVAPEAAAQTKPYIVYTLVFGQHAQTFSGRSTLKNARIQVDTYAETYSGARTLADHIYDAVDTNMSIGDSNEQAFYEDETELYRIMIDFSLWE